MILRSASRQRFNTLCEIHGDKFRFLVVGIFNTAFGYTLFLIMLFVVQTSLDRFVETQGAAPSFVENNYFIISQWTAWVLSVPVGTSTMKYFAFRSKGHVGEEILRSYFVYLPAAVASSALLWFTVRVVGLHPSLGQLVTIAFATTFSYFGHKYFTFRMHKSS